VRRRNTRYSAKKAEGMDLRRGEASYKLSAKRKTKKRKKIGKISADWMTILDDKKLRTRRESLVDESNEFFRAV
jgi:hypothetical protein